MCDFWNRTRGPKFPRRTKNAKDVPTPSLENNAAILKGVEDIFAFFTAAASLHISVQDLDRFLSCFDSIITPFLSIFLFGGSSDYYYGVGVVHIEQIKPREVKEAILRGCGHGSLLWT